MINLVKNEQVEQMPHLRGHENKDAQHRYSFQKRKIKTSKLYHTPIKIDNIRSMTLPSFDNNLKSFIATANAKCPKFWCLLINSVCKYIGLPLLGKSW
jgi:hypothetical protein